MCVNTNTLVIYFSDINTCRTVPSLSTTNTMSTHTTPIITTTNLIMLLATLSLILCFKQGRTKSSKSVAPSAFRLLDIVL